MIAGCVDVPASRCEVFNVGADEPTTVSELALIVAAAFDVEPNVRHLEARNEVVDAYASHEKARRIFGERDGVSLADGIGRMAAWARKRGPQPTPAFGEIEVLRNLPPSWRTQLAVDGA